MTSFALSPKYEQLVFAAFVPVYACAYAAYGFRVLNIAAVCLLTGLIVDGIASVLTRPRFGRFSWLTWFFFPLILPPGVPFWAASVGLAVGLVFAVHFFGGYGRNLFNPVILGLVFLLLGYHPSMQGSFCLPYASPPDFSHSDHIGRGIGQSLRAFLAEHADRITRSDVCFGRVPNLAGGSFPVLLMCLLILLLAVRAIDYRWPLGVIFGYSLLLSLGRITFPWLQLPSFFYLLSGTFWLVTIVASVDTFSLPRTIVARWICGFFAGGLGVILLAGSYATFSVFFAVLCAQTIGPLVDQWVLSVKYSGRWSKE